MKLLNLLQLGKIYKEYQNISLVYSKLDESLCNMILNKREYTIYYLLYNILDYKN